MINETEHFILTNLEGKDAGGVSLVCDIIDGAKILAKNVDGSTDLLLYINYAPVHGCYLEIPGSNLQDYITSWELFVELVKLLDEAYEKITFAHAVKEFSESLN